MTIRAMPGLDDDPYADARAWLEVTGKVKPWLCENCGRKFDAQTGKIYPNAYVLSHRMKFIALIVLVIVVMGAAITAIVVAY